MKLASHDRAMSRRNARRKLVDAMRNSAGHRLPGSMNPKKGSGERARRGRRA